VFGLRMTLDRPAAVAGRAMQVAILLIHTRSKARAEEGELGPGAMN
jgi:hypothetical protein